MSLQSVTLPDGTFLYSTDTATEWLCARCGGDAACADALKELLVGEILIEAQDCIEDYQNLETEKEDLKDELEIVESERDKYKELYEKANA